MMRKAAQSGVVEFRMLARVILAGIVLTNVGRRTVGAKQTESETAAA